MLDKNRNARRDARNSGLAGDRRHTRPRHIGSSPRLPGRQRRNWLQPAAHFRTGWKHLHIHGAAGNYDGADDALIGVVNNSGHVLASFNVSGSNIFGFEGDGINTYGASPSTGNPDTTGYGGPLGYFTNIAPSFNSGTVNFWRGLTNGKATYFSLEESISQSSLPVITRNVPEPPTLPVFGLGLIGMGWLAWRRKSA